MLGTDVLWGPERGARVLAMIEGALGAPCACRSGGHCAILGDGRQVDRTTAQQAVILPATPKAAS